MTKRVTQNQIIYGTTAAGEVWKPMSGRNLLLLLENTFYCPQHIEFYKSVSFLVGLRMKTYSLF